MKLLTIVGARPQFIKAAPFSKEFRQNNEEILVHTGQHYDRNMSDIFFTELSIPKPDYNLGIGSCSHGMQTGRMLEKIEELLIKEKPEGVLVYGDTNSTLAGALAASKLHIPVYHVEAGIRSYNMRMPEEQNRVLTDHISSLLLCPTSTAVDNLKREGLTRGVFNTGDIMYDAVVRNIGISKQRYSKDTWQRELKVINMKAPELKSKEFYLATVHRAENTDNASLLSEIIMAFTMLDKPVLLPIHPRTQKLMSKLNLPLKNIIVTEPVGYLLMLYLTESAYMVLTDSGGLQKEAYFLRTPCTTLRDQTEWPETLENGWNVLAPINAEDIINRATRPYSHKDERQVCAFGNGYSAKRMIELIMKNG